MYPTDFSRPQAIESCREISRLCKQFFGIDHFSLFKTTETYKKWFHGRNINHNYPYPTTKIILKDRITLFKFTI